LAENCDPCQFAYRHCDVLELHFVPLEGKFAFDSIIDVLDSMNIKLKDWPSTTFLSLLMTSDIREELRLMAQRSPSVARKLFAESHLTYRLFDHQKFAPLPVGQVSARLRQFSSLLPRLGGVQVTELGRDMFRLTAAAH